MSSLNDLISDTPGMKRFTDQIIALEKEVERVCVLGLKTDAEIVVFVNKFMDENDHDELGGHFEINEMVTEFVFGGWD